MFHQVAVLAHELRRLHRDHPGVEGFEAFVARRGRGRDLILFLGRLLLPILGLLLGEEILDGLHVLQAGLRGHGGLRQLLRCGFETLKDLLVLEGGLNLLVHVFVYVVDVLGHLDLLSLVPWEAPTPRQARASYTSLARMQPRKGAHAVNAPEGPGIPIGGAAAARKDENPRDLWGRDAGAVTQRERYRARREAVNPRG